jgi:hypothetical protein
MQTVTVAFKGEKREINMTFNLNEEGSLDYNVSVVPEITPEDDAMELETRLAFIFLKTLEGNAQE